MTTGKERYISLSRFGLCIGAALILVFYSNAAASTHLTYYLPIGVVLMSAYSWLVIKKLRGIYPVSSRAIGQLSLTFLVYGLTSFNQMNNIKQSIKQGLVADDATIYKFACNVVQSNIAV